MQNPFNHENYPSNELKRNTFPCSFQNNLTMKYGYIYPAGVWRTVPGATYKIKPTLGLNFMPTTFPVQTRQKVYVHYFYGRDRNFWKDYKDFVNGQRPDLVKPYIDESVTQARTGKLLDYLGVPTTLVGKYGFRFDSSNSIKPVDFVGVNTDFQALTALNGPLSNPKGSSWQFVMNRWISYEHNPYSDQPKFSSWPDKTSYADVLNTPFLLTSGEGTYFSTVFDFPFDPSKLVSPEIRIPLAAKSQLYYNNSVFYGDIDEWLNLQPVSAGGNTNDYNGPNPFSENIILNYFAIVLSDSEGTFKGIVYKPKNTGNGVLSFNLQDYDLTDVTRVYLIVPNFIIGFFSGYGTSVSIANDDDIIIPIELQYPIVEDAKVIDIDDTTSPYWRSGATTDLRERIKLNAYLPRFYETVYNLYYRNPQNNPYILDGRPEYNRFIPSKDGGVDSNLYELRRRNWEDDFLTTAVQSPQQGIAPLVGLTDRGATLTLTNDDGTVTRYNVTTSDNGSITGIEANDINAEPVLTKALIDAVSYGISIEDIRNVNAMQKWLELNLRKGYQYKDIIQARWGISISYNELDLPEFIGGFTKDVQLQAVTQTANVNDDVTGQLGWQGGRLFAQGEGREITHYCDEEGYIMCLITVVPVPNYSQLLPKHWIERDLLDSYQPEFNHIGFQPITYKEVCPIQSYQESTANVNVLEQTFGYQRPWYQYFNYTDEVHGQFRTTFKDFLINRVFDVKPELSESFLLVDPEQINDVFNVPDSDDDKIIGAIYHNCVAKLPISLYAQARLE